MKNLVIVESPTKARTISHFLGSDFLVISSYGHIRDLPKSKLGVDIEKNFQPIYVIPPKARKIIKELKEKKKKSQKVILACDEDREGEAIAWHLAEVLNLQKPERIVFHEITKKAILEALKKPRAIDFNLVKAQQARRVLDRLVGYKLSPFLWHKITRGLSAGRVQSAALRLIVEREKEIKEFKPKDYWTIEALLEKEKKEFKAILFAKNGKKLEKFFLNTEKKAKEIVNLLKGKPFFVSQIEEKEITKNPLPPFKTSTLQQEAWRE
ncbi:toprim domain-containing protein, partial [bacterium]|nr:toprim domain-containing protein [bacterium]